MDLVPHFNRWGNHERTPGGPFLTSTMVEVMNRLPLLISTVGEVRNGAPLLTSPGSHERTPVPDFGSHEWTPSTEKS